MVNRGMFLQKKEKKKRLISIVMIVQEWKQLPLPNPPREDDKGQ